MSIDPPRSTLPRGVWNAPGRGLNDEFVFLVVDRHGHFVMPLQIAPAGTNHLAFLDRLWDALDILDPPDLAGVASTTSRPRRLLSLHRRELARRRGAREAAEG